MGLTEEAVTVAPTQGSMTVNQKEFGEATVLVIVEYATPFRVTEVTETLKMPALEYPNEVPVLNKPPVEIV